MDRSRGRGEGGRGRGGGRGDGLRGRGRGRGRGGRGAPYEGGSYRSRVTNPTKLHVSNLPEDVTKSELQSIFETCGKVLECDIIRDFAFVHYAESEEADRAVNKLHGYSIKGTAINVRHSTSTLRQKPGATKGDCFRCGGRGHDSTECPTTLREQGLLPPRYPQMPYDDPYDRYARALPRDPYLDPYARLGREAYLRRRALPAFDRYDPYLDDPYMRDPYARELLRRDPYARSSMYESQRDEYGRPPPEFYQKGQGRAKGMDDSQQVDDFGGSGLNETAIKSLLASAGDSLRNARGMSDGYFYSDDYGDSNRIPNP